jgi:hypothetical protein
MPGQATMDAFLTHARSLPRPLPLVGHIRHDSQMPGAVYIGRRVGNIPASKYGNPFVIGKDGDRAAVIAAFERHARACLAADPHWLDALNQARVLTCWCRRIGEARPACHGDTLIMLIRERDDA